MKVKIVKAAALILAMLCILCFPIPASAVSQGTDGTELQVMKPQNLQIHLGEEWAGIGFELTTDAGKYPGVIPVGEDGVLRLEIGGRLEFATDHEEYFHVVEECFAGDARFRRVAPMERGPDEWTEFETLFRGQGLPVHAAAWQSLAVEDEKPLAPLSVAPEDEPREGVVRRESRGKEWREEHADSD